MTARGIEARRRRPDPAGFGDRLSRPAATVPPRRLNVGWTGSPRRVAAVVLLALAASACASEEAARPPLDVSLSESAATEGPEDQGQAEMETEEQIASQQTGSVEREPLDPNLHGFSEETTSPSSTVFNSVTPVDAASAQAALDSFLGWCLAYFQEPGERPLFQRDVFVDRAQGFGLWALVPTPRIAGGREDGACAGFLQSETIALLPGGLEGVIAAAAARFGLDATPTSGETRNGWPITLVEGVSSIVGAPVIIRFMTKRPDSFEGDPGDVKITVGLLAAEN